MIKIPTFTIVNVCIAAIFLFLLQRKQLHNYDVQYLRTLLMRNVNCKELDSCMWTAYHCYDIPVISWLWACLCRSHSLCQTDAVHVGRRIPTITNRVLYWSVSLCKQIYRQQVTMSFANVIWHNQLIICRMGQNKTALYANCTHPLHWVIILKTLILLCTADNSV